MDPKGWKLLACDMEPTTRQKGLALVTQLSKVEFWSSKTITEQIPAYESLVQECERISGEASVQKIP